jgi:hypothetical protein
MTARRAPQLTSRQAKELLVRGWRGPVTATLIDPTGAYGGLHIPGIRIQGGPLGG